jgi:hypothetical protein
MATCEQDRWYIPSLGAPKEVLRASWRPANKTEVGISPRWVHPKRCLVVVAAGVDSTRPRGASILSSGQPIVEEALREHRQGVHSGKMLVHRCGGWLGEATN